MNLPKFDPSRADAANRMFDYTDFNSTANTMCIKITEGYFKNVVFHYKRVRVNEPSVEIPEPSLTFEYEIDDVPETIVVEELTPELHEEFEILIGDILVNVIQDKIDRDAREDNSKPSSV